MSLSALRSRQTTFRAAALGLALLALWPCPPLAPAAAAPGARPRGEASGDARRVLQAMEGFFAAMRAGDADGAAALLIADGMLFSERRNADGGYSLHHMSNAEWLAQFRAWNGHMEDRPSQSRVRVWGPIATISQRFVFQRNGRVTHCGVNLFQLVRAGPDWRIANIVWTEEHEGCS